MKKKSLSPHTSKDDSLLISDENEDDEDSNGEGEKAQEGKTGPAENEQSGRKVMDKPGQLKDNKMLTHRADVRSTKTSVEVGRKERSERTKMREHRSEPLEAYSNDLKTSERRSRGEPMEIETMTTDASAAVRGEEDCLTGKSSLAENNVKRSSCARSVVLEVAMSSHCFCFFFCFVFMLSKLCASMLSVGVDV